MPQRCDFFENAAAAPPRIPLHSSPGKKCGVISTPLPDKKRYFLGKINDCACSPPKKRDDTNKKIRLFVTLLDKSR